MAANVKDQAMDNLRKMMDAPRESKQAFAARDAVLCSLEEALAARDAAASAVAEATAEAHASEARAAAAEAAAVTAAAVETGYALSTC